LTHIDELRQEQRIPSHALNGLDQEAIYTQLIISQMDFILKVVTWVAISIEESMQIFEPHKKSLPVETERTDDFPD